MVSISTAAAGGGPLKIYVNQLKTRSYTQPRIELLCNTVYFPALKVLEEFLNDSSGILKKSQEFLRLLVFWRNFR